MTNEVNALTIGERVLKAMTDQGEATDLWTANNLKDALGIDLKSAANKIATLHLDGQVFRHQMNGTQGRARYALDIPIEDRRQIKSASYTATKTGSGYKPKKRKGHQSTPKEIRMLFAELQRNLIQLEDAVMARIDEAFETEKNLDKLRNLL